jgi:hypothetical protein
MGMDRDEGVFGAGGGLDALHFCHAKACPASEAFNDPRKLNAESNEAAARAQPDQEEFRPRL